MNFKKTFIFEIPLFKSTFVIVITKFHSHIDKNSFPSNLRKIMIIPHHFQYCIISS